MNLQVFRAQNPDAFVLDPNQPAALETYLRRRQFLEAEESVQTLERAGAGNMNCTLRVTTSRRSFIAKQSRPWVEKYPQFAAPWDRTRREMEFYRIASGIPQVAAALPRVLHADADSRLILLEDLGAAGDYTDCYRGAAFTGAEIDTLAAFLAGLHAAFPSRAGGAALSNREMRALNHAHIFDIPLRTGNGLDLEAVCPGLEAEARQLRDDDAFRDEVRRLGQQVYLTDGPCLLHGDFFPGSLIRTAHGPRIIDPEFGFFGRPEIDVGNFAAHLLLARQPTAVVHRWSARYSGPAGFDLLLVRRLAGVEVMRRVIGYAQLPLADGLPVRRDLLALARELVLQPAGPAAATALGPQA